MVSIPHSSKYTAARVERRKAQALRPALAAVTKVAKEGGDPRAKRAAVLALAGWKPAGITPRGAARLRHESGAVVEVYGFVARKGPTSGPGAFDRTLVALKSRKFLGQR